jgi:hypothetical protein
MGHQEDVSKFIMSHNSMSRLDDFTSFVLLSWIPATTAAARAHKLHLSHDEVETLVLFVSIF